VFFLQPHQICERADPMRFACLPLLFAATFCVSPAAAKDTAKLRPATATEIRQTLTKTSNLKDAPNGYQYREGGKIGYRIDNGKICVLQQRKSECVTVYTDGKRLETIDRRGNRNFLN